MPWLRAFGKHLPERLVDNHELAALLEADPAWIHEMSGIETRRYAAPEETVADMAVAAAQQALAAAQIDATQLGLVIVSSGSSERQFPGPAAEVQHRLGAANAWALDVPLASAGSLFALAQAAQWAPRVGKVLVVAAEKMSPAALTPPYEKGTAMLFGDGAGACVVDPHQGLARILDFELATDGANTPDLYRLPGEPIHMNGRAVILHAVRKVPSIIHTVLQRQQRAATDIGVFLMHQANANLIAKIAATLGVPPEKFFRNIDRYGNTSSASLLIAAAEWPGPWHGPVMLAAFGAGFHWGAMLVEGENTHA